jgi:hypothetical protein
MPVEGFKSLIGAYRDGGIQRAGRAIEGHLAVEYPFLTAMARYYWRRGRGAPEFHPFAVYLANPADIDRYVEWSTFEHFPNATRIRSGEWDREARPIDSFGKYQLVRRYLSGSLAAEELDRDRLLEYDYPESEVARYARCYGEYIDDLRESIAAEGIRLWDSDPQTTPFDRFDYVALDIGRDGELLFDSNGCHRISIARELGIEQIPVRINAIHEEWYADNGPPTDHPDLTHLTTVPIRWRDIYRLETTPPVLSTHGV